MHLTELTQLVALEFVAVNSTKGESCLHQTYSVAVLLAPEVSLHHLCHRRWLLRSADSSSLQLPRQAQILPLLVSEKVRGCRTTDGEK